ncbi:unnamed protein product [Tetraodon nigroviridis]|uniref:(spotted green pufferfish) hypothetical protein n=1 Tax=Tetraodon nigroviridis TaxID=99883 RepID=Q4RY37_TETNG|nr:unnamed protein product [Tetraodon nigroviridis]
MALNIASIRDTKWLTLEVCRQFQRGTCSRSDEECKFAHPPKSCQVENGRVIACFDSLKGNFDCNLLSVQGRCTRENCKYLHPPAHLKTQLEINGRNNLIQQKTAAAMLAQQMQFMIPSTTMQPVQTFPVSQGLGSSTGLSYTPYLTPMSHSMGLVPTDILPSTPVIVPGSPPVSVAAGSSSNQKLLRTDKLEVNHFVCQSRCDNPSVLMSVVCSYLQRRVPVMFVKMTFHLQAKVKAAQHQANQTAVAAQAAATAAAMTQSTAKAMKRPLEATVDLAFPHSGLQPLPKRPALEKSNGSSSLFNPSVLHYQQALANAQLQQPAFFPTGSVLCMTPASSLVPMMYSVRLLLSLQQQLLPQVSPTQQQHQPIRFAPFKAFFHQSPEF